MYDIFQDLKVNKYLEKVSTKINGEIRLFPGAYIYIYIMSTKLTLQKTLKRLIYREKKKRIVSTCIQRKNVFHENKRLTEEN